VDGWYPRGLAFTAMVALRRAGALFAVIVLAFGLSGAVAGAKKHHKKHKKHGSAWASKVTLTHQTTTQFAGVVSSNLGACEGARVVTLTYTDPSTGQTSPLAVQRTDGSGRYEMTLANGAFAGTYQVQVWTQTVRARKANQTCQATQSSMVAV
jgi:hypothetical protein